MNKVGTGSKNLNYEVTLKEAERRFCEKNVARMAVLAGAAENGAGGLEVLFLEQMYVVSSHGQVRTVDDEEEVPLAVKILILHYLAYAQGTPVQNKHISFKELPGGGIYIGPFTNRAIRPLVTLFGGNPEELSRIGSTLGAQPVSLGDVSICLKTFPFVPITLVLWRGDDEFAPSGNILFDLSAPHFLPTEDYAVLASMVVYKLKNLKSIN